MRRTKGAVQVTVRQAHHGHYFGLSVRIFFFFIILWFLWAGLMVTLLFFCMPFIFSAPTSEVYELSNSDFDENILEDLAIIFAVLPV